MEGNTNFREIGGSIKTGKIGGIPNLSGKGKIGKGKMHHCLRGMDAPDLIVL